MAEALSQSQIDALLNRIRSGDIEDTPQEKVKEYDFSSPKKFTKDQLNSLGNFYENFCRVISSYFTSILRSVCEVNIAQIEEQRYHEFSNALSENSLVGMISFNPEDKDSYDETTVMLDLSTSFGYLLIDRLMGGSREVYVPDRDYTEIELAILESVLTETTNYLGESWNNYLPVETKLQSIETNGRLIQVFSPQDIVVIVSLEIKEERFSGTANICMLAENLEKIINSFAIKYSHSVKKQDPEKERLKHDVMMYYLKQSNLTIEAVLENCKMDFASICSLQTNDIIVLNKKIDSDLTVNIEGNPWYTARLGEVDDKKALKLVNTIQK